MRDYSTGTITKRRSKKGYQWQAIISYQEHGKQRQVTKMLGIACDPPKKGEIPASGKGARQALKALAAWRDELVAEQERKHGIITPDATVAEYYDAYLEGKAGEVAAKTLRDYGYCRRYIAKLDMPVGELTPMHVQQWRDAMNRERPGSRTNELVFRQLKACLAWGVRMQQLVSNPCDAVKTPKPAKRNPNPLDDAGRVQLEAELVLLQADKPQLAFMARMALLTGLRLGELCALPRSVLRAEHIEVREHVVGSQLLPATKNGKTRRIKVNSALRALLDDVEAWHTLYDTQNAEGYLFALPTDPEHFPRPQTISHYWAKFVKRNGIIGCEGLPLHFHDLRHTFATHALLAGVDVVSVSGLLGHSDTQITFKTYTRWLPDRNDAAMDRLGELQTAVVQ